MKIVADFPPNIKAIEKAGFAINENTIFAYGDTIYNPGGKGLESHLLIHEEEHQRQQGDDPAGWWDKYIKHPEFRFDMELLAYRAQYKYYEKDRTRNDANRLLHKLAMDLSGGLYGNIVNYQKAKNMIKKI